MARFLALIACLAAFIPGPAAAQTETDFAGRWQLTSNGMVGDIRDGIVLDITRCGEGWCGIRVEGERCGPLAMRLTPGRPSGEESFLDGRFSLNGPEQRYETVVYRRGNRLWIRGHQDRRQLFRRVLPLQIGMKLVGSAQCRPATPVS